MTVPTLDELLRTWTHRAASERAISSPALEQAVMQLLADGRPATTADIARATGAPPGHVQEQIDAAAALGCEVQDGAIVGAALHRGAFRSDFTPTSSRRIIDVRLLTYNHDIPGGSVSTVSTLLDDMLHTDIVDAPDIARVLGTTARSVTRWTASGATPRRDNEERLLELKAVVDTIRQVMRDEPARLWLRSPIPALDYEKPIELVERGEYRRVIGAILAVAEGVTA